MSDVACLVEPIGLIFQLFVSARTDGPYCTSDNHIKHEQRTMVTTQKQHTRRSAVKLDKFVKQSKLSTYDHQAAKKKKFEKNASLLRGYKKSLKEEGFDASISRKRSRRRAEGEDSASAGNEDRESKAKTGEDHVGDDAGRKKKKYRKTDPLFKAKQQAELKKKERAEKLADIEQGKLNRAKKLKERKIKSKRMMGRTKKGQPFLDNEIFNMLEKIKKTT